MDMVSKPLQSPRPEPPSVEQAQGDSGKKKLPVLSVKPGISQLTHTPASSQQVHRSPGLLSRLKRDTRSVSHTKIHSRLCAFVDGGTTGVGDTMKRTLAQCVNMCCCSTVTLCRGMYYISAQQGCQGKCC